MSVLEKLKRPGQLTIYYIGGLEVVRQKLCSDPVARTLFHSSGGFELADSHCQISRCLNSEPVFLTSSDVQLATGSDVSPWPWPLRPKSKSLALALTPQVLGLGLGLVA